MSKKAPKADQRKQLEVFEIGDSTSTITLDRSTLERWAECPFQAKELEAHHQVMPEIAEVGTLVHAACSNVILEWIAMEGQCSAGDLTGGLDSALRGSRPDLQPKVIDAMGWSVWEWSRLIWGIHPVNILRFDGGEAIDRSGQLSIHFDDLGVIVTSEIDLLYAGPSAELLHEVDYKTGHKVYTAAMVRDSFQFQLHAVLVFHNYPEVNGLELVVWNTRKNDRTFKVVFKRDDLPDFTSRIRMAIQTRLQQYDNPETWPTLEKCGNCDVAAKCPVADQQMRNIEEDPRLFLLDMVAVSARLDAMKAVAVKHIDRTGADIVAAGICFGRSKPKKEKKATAEIYETKADEKSQE